MLLTNIYKYIYIIGSKKTEISRNNNNTIDKFALKG